MRVVSGCLAAVFTAVLGGLIMGEYELRGAMALLAGLLFGLAIAEVAITIGKSSDWPLVAVSALSAFVGLTWAAYIDAGNSLGRVAAMRWVGSLLALVGAGWWVRSLGSRALSSQPAEESA
ncbi:MAG: hypothetical protein Q8K63_15365 [Acidimicrobiales bacterium]|nr:hypothetical protein [Acidimicrobiales bacterium]